MKGYLTNLHRTVREVNQKALNYGDGKAWDNKKIKTAKRHFPRGPAFKQLEARRRLDELSRINAYCAHLDSILP